MADITYFPTWSGFLYLAIVRDMSNRRVVGWSMSTPLNTDVVLAVLNKAVAQRKPKAVIHHADQLSQIPRSRSATAVARPACGSR